MWITCRWFCQTWRCPVLYAVFRCTPVLQVCLARPSLFGREGDHRHARSGDAPSLADSQGCPVWDSDVTRLPWSQGLGIAPRASSFQMRISPYPLRGLAHLGHVCFAKRPSLDLPSISRMPSVPVLSDRSPCVTHCKHTFVASHVRSAIGALNAFGCLDHTLSLPRLHVGSRACLFSGRERSSSFRCTMLRPD